MGRITEDGAEPTGCILPRNREELDPEKDGLQ